MNLEPLFSIYQTTPLQEFVENPYTVPAITIEGLLSIWVPVNDPDLQTLKLYIPED